MYFFRKRDPNRPTSFNLKVMHTINAIAIIMFLAGIIWKLIDWFILKKWFSEVENVVEDVEVVKVLPIQFNNYSNHSNNYNLYNFYN